MSDHHDRAQIKTILKTYPDLRALHLKWKDASRRQLKDALNDLWGLDGEDDPRRPGVYAKSASKAGLLLRIMERLASEERRKTRGQR